MKLKKAVEGMALAVLYFGIYMVWQFIVMFAAAFGVSLKVSLMADLAYIVENAAQMTDEAYIGLINSYAVKAQEAYIEFIGKYAIHLTAIAAVLTLVTYFIIFKVRKRSIIKEAGLTKLPLLHGFAMILFGGFLNVFVTLVMSAIPFPEEWLTSYTDASAAVSDTTSVVTVIFTVLGAPIIEEIVYRGLCYNSLKRGIPMLAAMIISSWGFGISHGTAIWIIYASLLGFVLVWLREKYRSLTAPLLVHISFNLMGLLLSLTGEMPGGFYAALCVVSGIACAAFVLFVVRTSKHKIELVMNQEENAE